MLTLKLIDKGDSVLWKNGCLVFDILDMVFECDNYIFKHIKREASDMAYKITKVGGRVGHCYVWDECLQQLSCPFGWRKVRFFPIHQFYGKIVQKKKFYSQPIN